MRARTRRHAPAPPGALLLLAFIAALAFATIGCGTEAGPASAVEPSPPTATSTPTPAPPTPTPTPSPRWPVTLAAVGDIMLTRSVANAITEEDPGGPFAHLGGLLAATDITIGNLETAISDRGEPEPKGYTFRSNPLAAKSLQVAGFDVVALANNHTLDYGETALFDTLEHLREAGVAAVGAGRNAAEAHDFAVIERAGLRLAVLSFAEVPNEAGYSMEAWAADEDTPGIAWADDDDVAGAVSAATQAADRVVVMFHFGHEYATTPSGRQRHLARLAIDAGASLVVGSHPHVLQEVEEYGGGLIAYSLGNFVFDGFEGLSNETAILLVSFEADGRLEWQIVPAQIGWDGLPRLTEAPNP